VLLRESGMTQLAIAEAMGVSLSIVNRAQMADDAGGIKALRPKPIGGRQRQNMTEGVAGTVYQCRWGGRDVEQP
jgi:transposase